MSRNALAVSSAAILAMASAPVAAQVVQDEQRWLNATLFGSIGSLVYFFEAQPRFGNGISRLD